jgi:hypothetical protein
VGRQLLDAKILLEIEIDILLDAPQHACWESAALLLLGGDGSRVEFIQTWSCVYSKLLPAAALQGT